MSFVMLLCSAVSCTNGSESVAPPIPKGLIASEKMEKVLIDIQLAEAYLQMIKTDTIAHKVPIEEYYQQIFAIHGVDYESFRKSFEYYTHYPDTLLNMHEDMLNMLSKIESAATNSIKNR